jgi:hypothetical protein
LGLWKESCDEGGLAWDDTSNNRAFLSGSISATNNSASIYSQRCRKLRYRQLHKHGAQIFPNDGLTIRTAPQLSLRIDLQCDLYLREVRLLGVKVAVDVSIG